MRTAKGRGILQKSVPKSLWPPLEVEGAAVVYEACGWLVKLPAPGAGLPTGSGRPKAAILLAGRLCVVGGGFWVDGLAAYWFSMSSPVISWRRRKDREGILAPVYLEGVGSTGRSEGGRRRSCWRVSFCWLCCCWASELFTGTGSGGVGGGVQSWVLPGVPRLTGGGSELWRFMFSKKLFDSLWLLFEDVSGGSWENILFRSR